MDQTVRGRVVDVISDFMAVPKDRVVGSANLVEDLEIDSLDHIELTMELEDEFDLSIADDAAEQWKTVDDVVKYMEGHGKK